MYSEDAKAILNRLFNNVSNEVDKTEGSLTYDSLSPAAIEFSNAYKKLDEIATKLYIENLSDDELEKRIYQHTGITRHPATYATGVLNVTGTGTISQGALFQTSGGIQFQATETKSIINSGTINVKAVIPGSNGMVPANQITSIPVAIMGITTVANPNPTTNGYDAESDDSLRQRYYEKLQAPATSGNKAHYKIWAKEVTGVGDAKVFPLWAGNGTVKVVIINSNKRAADNQLVATVQNYIDPDSKGTGEGQAPIGAKTTVLSAVEEVINVSATLVIDTKKYTLTQVKTSIEANLTKYFKDIAFINNYVSYASIGNLIFNTDGVIDYSNLLVNGNTSNIVLGDEEIPVLGTASLGV